MIALTAIVTHLILCVFILFQFSAFLPLNTRLPGTTSNTRRPVGLNYSITYLDEDLFIGRAQGNGGTFIFVRDD